MEAKNESQRTATAEACKQALDSCQRALDEQWLDSRMEDGRMGRCLALIEQEAEMEKDFQERTDQAAIVNARAKEETRLGAEMAKVRDKEVGHMQRRHFAQEDDEDLEKKPELKKQSLDNEYKSMEDRRTDQEAIVNARAVEETRLGAEMAKVRDKEVGHMQRRHFAQAKDPGFWEVEKKPEAGYVCQDLNTQILDNEYKTMQDRVEENPTNRVLLTALYNDMQQAEREEPADMEQHSAIEAEGQSEMQVREVEKQMEEMGRNGFEDAEAGQERADRSLQERYLEAYAQDDASQLARSELYRAEARQDWQEHVQRRAQQARNQRDEDVQSRKESDELQERGDEMEREMERKKRERNLQYSADLRRQIEGNASRHKADKDREMKQYRERNEHGDAWNSKVAHEREMIVEARAASGSPDRSPRS